MCKKCGWEEVLDQTKDMLENDQFKFAFETIEGIREWVEDNAHVTEKQKAALDNIQGSVD